MPRLLCALFVLFAFSSGLYAPIKVDIHRETELTIQAAKQASDQLLKEAQETRKTYEQFAADSQKSLEHVKKLKDLTEEERESWLKEQKGLIRQERQNIRDSERRWEKRGFEGSQIQVIEDALKARLEGKEPPKIVPAPKPELEPVVEREELFEEVVEEVTPVEVAPVEIAPEPEPEPKLELVPEPVELEAEPEPEPEVEEPVVEMPEVIEEIEEKVVKKKVTRRFPSFARFSRAAEKEMREKYRAFAPKEVEVKVEPEPEVVEEKPEIEEEPVEYEEPALEPEPEPEVVPTEAPFVAPPVPGVPTAMPPTPAAPPGALLPGVTPALRPGIMHPGVAPGVMPPVTPTPPTPPTEEVPPKKVVRPRIRILPGFKNKAHFDVAWYKLQYEAASGEIRKIVAPEEEEDIERQKEAKKGIEKQIDEKFNKRRIKPLTLLKEADDMLDKLPGNAGKPNIRKFIDLILKMPPFLSWASAGRGIENPRNIKPYQIIRGKKNPKTADMPDAIWEKVKKNEIEFRLGFAFGDLLFKLLHKKLLLRSYIKPYRKILTKWLWRYGKLNFSWARRKKILPHFFKLRPTRTKLGKAKNILVVYRRILDKIPMDLEKVVKDKEARKIIKGFIKAKDARKMVKDFYVLYRIYIFRETRDPSFMDLWNTLVKKLTSPRHPVKGLISKKDFTLIKIKRDIAIKYPRTVRPAQALKLLRSLALDAEIEWALARGKINFKKNIKKGILPGRLRSPEAYGSAGVSEMSTKLDTLLSIVKELITPKFTKGTDAMGKEIQVPVRGYTWRMSKLIARKLHVHYIRMIRFEESRVTPNDSIRNKLRELGLELLKLPRVKKEDLDRASRKKLTIEKAIELVKPGALNFDKAFDRLRSQSRKLAAKVITIRKNMPIILDLKQDIASRMTSANTTPQDVDKFFDFIIWFEKKIIRTLGDRVYPRVAVARRLEYALAQEWTRRFIVIAAIAYTNPNINRKDIAQEGKKVHRILQMYGIDPATITTAPPTPATPATSEPAKAGAEA